MLTDAQFVAVADAFGLGDVIAHTGPTGRGESGFVFRLTTSTGSWAVKRLIHSQLEVEAREDIEFVAAARAAGVPTPAMLTTRGGAALLDLPDTQVRVSEWVDLLDVDPALDATAVGAAVGALHRTPFHGRRGERPWYRQPVGAARWDELIAALTDARAPFADDLAGLREEFVALERIMADPQDLRTCHRDLFPENLRGTDAGSVRHRLGQPRSGRREPGIGLRGLWFRRRPGRPRPNDRGELLGIRRPWPRPDPR